TPFGGERSWPEASASRIDRCGVEGAHPLLQRPDGQPTPSWTSDLHRNFLPWLDGHRVDGAVVLPGAAMIEAGLAMARATGRPAALVDVRFEKMLLAERANELRAAVDDDGGFTLHSRPVGDDDGWLRHAVGRIAAAAPG